MNAFASTRNRDRTCSSRPETGSRTTSTSLPRTALCWETRDECIEEIRRYEALGFNYLIIDYHWLDLDDDAAKNTLRLFGERVMPAFR